MTCPDAKTWNLLSMNLLDEDRAESLRRHSLECEPCHTAWQEASRRHTELLDTFQAFDRNHDQRRDQLMTMLPESAAFSKKEGGIAMTLRRHKIRWAAAALLSAACVLLVFFLMPGEKIAFADVLQEVRQAKTMTCDFVTTTTVVEGQAPDQSLNEPTRGTISMVLDGDTPASLHEYKQPGSGSRIRSLYLGDRVYLWNDQWNDDKARLFDFSAMMSENRAEENMLSWLLKIRESPDRNLGEQMINGRRAVGFEIVGPKLGFGETRPTKGNPTPTDSGRLLRVWVDVEHNLPIRFESETKVVMLGGWTAMIHNQWDNIKWNVALDADDFRAPPEEDIAKDETVHYPPTDEAAFVDGMRAWLELEDKARAAIDVMKEKAKEKGEELPAQMSNLFEGAALNDGYPERLDWLWLFGGFSTRATLGMLGEMLPKLKLIPEDLGEEERAELIKARAKESAMATVQVSSQASVNGFAIAGFAQKLANEQRDPEYFGATVEPGDTEAILLKWRLDDGRYRVIYGDLRAETVDAGD